MKRLAQTRVEKPGASIFTVHSQQRDNDDVDRRRQGYFLDACYLCGRKIVEHQNIYMYGYVFSINLL